MDVNQIDVLLDPWAERAQSSASIRVPAHLRWMGADGIASILDFKPRYLLEHLSALPGFPQPLRIGGDGHPRWNVDEVQALALARRDQHQRSPA